jgi:hypothetical protein
MSYFTPTEDLDYPSLDLSETLLDDMVRENTTTSPTTAEDAAPGADFKLELQNIEQPQVRAPLTEAEKAARKERRKIQKKERRERAQERDLITGGTKGMDRVEMMKMRKAGLEGRDGGSELKDVIKRVAYLENFMKRVTSLEGEERGGSSRGKREKGGGRGAGRRGGLGRGRGGVSVSAGGDDRGEGKAPSGESAAN